MSKNYFIADLHYAHGDISKKFRNIFSSDEEHDNTIHQNIMDCAGKRNQLWLLGDLFFNPSTFTKLDEYAKYFDNVNITLGNHDHKSLAKYAAQFDNVHIFGILKKFGYWVSHAPIHTCELYRAKSLHGHTHNKCVTKLDERAYPLEVYLNDDRYLSVSCEQVDYKPVTLEWIKERL